MMNTIEIKCEACEAKMRLSPRLLGRIQGHTGRITCKQCSNKVALDASGEFVAVTSGGVLLQGGAAFELALPEDDPHLSELPAPGDSGSRIELERRTSVPPPLPVGARASRRQSMEAPVPPPMRELADSLSPHAFEDGASLAELAHDIRSTPYAAPPPRDQTYNSLYPDPEPARKTSPIRTMPYGSRAPTPPRAGELHRSMAPHQNPFESGYGIDVPQGPQAVVVTADGQLLNQADLRQIGSRSSSFADNGKGSKAPWILAAVALFALGLSVSAQFQDEISATWRSVGQQEKTSAAMPSVIHSASVPEVFIEAAAPPTVGLEAVDFPAVVSAPAATVLSGANAVQPASHQAQVEKVDTPAATSPVKASSHGDVLAEKSSAPSTLTSTTTPITDSPQTQQEASPPDAGPFSSGSAAAAMREATTLASSCRTAADPTGSARVVVTFAPSGRVTSATVSGPPFAGTSTGGCIASRFRAARVPAFSGEAVTVTKTVIIH